jgi:cold shock CspA family protein
MRFEGVLVAWNHDAGYGAIRPLQGGEQVFVSLAAFPTDGEGPRLDEALSFEIVSSGDGRKQAVRLRRLESAALQPSLREASGGGSARERARAAQRKRRLALAAGAVMMVVLVWGGVRWWQPGARAGNVPAAMRH